MRRVTSVEVHARKVEELGLHSRDLDLSSPEAIACALRRNASYLSPCSGATLIRSVVRPVRGLILDLKAFEAAVGEVLEAVVAHGDLVEYDEKDSGSDGTTGRLLFAVPLSFVARKCGAVILLGVARNEGAGLPEALDTRVEYVSHVRRLRQNSGEDLRNELINFGLDEVSVSGWLKMPRAETAAEHAARLGGLLDEAPPSRNVEGLTVLDSSKSVRYYRGRWTNVRSQTGRFVGRRRQAYGADLWCYVDLREGQPERLIDLPAPTSRWRGCDEAWRLQSAIDARSGKPQLYRVRAESAGFVVFELFSPVPQWARRRWDAVGEPITASGCLLGYRFPEKEAAEEREFARMCLWLEEERVTPLFV